MSASFEKARQIAQRLKEAGHEVYFAGGCVRDHLLGKQAKDIDIATSARPEEVKALFRRTIAVGAHFGVMIVVLGEDQFDVATFRADGAYGDGRRPDEVRFTTAEEDVARRDFTINGLLMEPESGAIIDYVGGEADLKLRRIRTIGAAKDRFQEDHLRILRALRFACRLDFEIESKTEAAIRELAEHAAGPSPERILNELDRMFHEANPARALQLLHSLGLLNVVLPEVAALAAVDAPPRLQSVKGEGIDLLQRKMRILKRVIGPTSSFVTWAVILGDLAPGKSQASARAAVDVLKRLRASNDLQKRVGFLIANRDRLLFAGRISVCRSRLLAAHPDLQLMQTYHRLEASVASADALVARPRDVLATSLPAPLLRGDELVASGCKKGRELGRILRRLRFLQLDRRISNREDALSWLAARDKYSI